MTYIFRTAGAFTLTANYSKLEDLHFITTGGPLTGRLLT